MFEFEIKFEVFDYNYKKLVTRYDYINASNENDAKTKAYYMYSNAIDILHVLDVNDPNFSFDNQ